MTYFVLIWELIATIAIPLLILSFIAAYAWHCYCEEKEYKLFMEEIK